MLGVTYDPNVKSDREVENTNQMTSNEENLPPHEKQVKRHLFLDLSVWKVPAFVAITLSSAVAQFGHFVLQIHLVCRYVLTIFFKIKLVQFENNFMGILTLYKILLDFKFLKVNFTLNSVKR